MKSIVVASVIAFVAAMGTMGAVSPASALNVHIGPRGVGVGLGHRYRGGYRGGVVRRGVVRPVFRNHRRFR